MAGDFQDRPVLVTGGAGFIGSHLVDTLLREGARVVVLDNFATGDRENLPTSDRLTLEEGDLRSREDCQRAVAPLAGGEESTPEPIVFHQGALGSVPRSLKDPATTLAVNAQGTAEIFASALEAGIRRVVYASSSSVYGDSERLPKREGEEGEPLSPYAFSKSLNEALARNFARCFGLRSVGLRYFNVYGPRQSPEGPYAAVIPLFFSAYRTGKAPLIHGDGEQSRDFTYVADAVAANLAAARYLLQPGAEHKVGGTLSALSVRGGEGSPADGARLSEPGEGGSGGRAPNGAKASPGLAEVVNVGGGGRTTVNQLAAAVREVCGGGPTPVHGPPRPGDVRDSLADLTRAKESFGYQPRVPLEEGLQLLAARLFDSDP